MLYLAVLSSGESGGERKRKKVIEYPLGFTYTSYLPWL